MKFNQQAVLNASVDEVDLEKWLFTLSDSEYQATARGHRGAGVFTEDGLRGSINVESIAAPLWCSATTPLVHSRSASRCCRRGRAATCFT